ncbi:hypothetical protein BT63DRAFT_182541 [Microthyrium microscopicum]|uniref:C2H2-type domain-containing protein n=1 Tax=Microthyrium microscopicum TaxID=703497 RepID=A0A6A6UHX1_9PEZI|nr:hypothetical protein BT63DRAFT_182541 [Microthyrium microscopicum]
MNTPFSCQEEDHSEICTTTDATSLLLAVTSAGLGLSLNESPLLRPMAPHTTDSFLESLFQTSGDTIFQNHGLLWQDDIGSGSIGDQTTWTSSPYQPSNVMGSPAMGLQQNAFGLEGVPGLQYSPGTTVSTRCDTPESVHGTLVDIKPSLTATPATSIMDFPWYSVAPTPPLNSMPMFPRAQSTHSAVLSTVSSPILPSHNLYPSIEKQEPEVKLEAFSPRPSSLPELNHPEGDEFAQKYRIMEENTRRVRQRVPKDTLPSERPQCPDCLVRFSRKHNLQQHQLMSCSKQPKKERDFVCGCGEAFHRTADLTRHQSSKHAPEKKFNCELCGQKFPRKDTLRRHWNKSCKQNFARPQKEDRKTKKRRLRASEPKTSQSQFTGAEPKTKQLQFITSNGPSPSP